MRTAHWLRGAESLRCPSAIVVLDTETHHGTQSTSKITYHELTLGYAIYYRLEKGKRTRQRDCLFTSISEFWTWLETVVDKRRTTHIFGHNLGYDLGILDAWNQFRGDKWGFYRIAIERNIVFIDCVLNGSHCVFVDTTNYWKVPLQTIATSLGMSKTELPDTNVVSASLIERCKMDVEITALAIDRLIEWITGNDYGPWAVSAAGLSMNTFKKRFMSHQILVHCNEGALALERAAYFGGLVDTPFIGELTDGPYYETDIVSMYPSVCLDSLPTVLVGVQDNPTVDVVKTSLEQYMAIADVTIQTPIPYYPFRAKTGTVFFQGKFRTCIADAELRYAIDHGHIVECHRLACYRHDRIFADFMQHFLRQKISARTHGDVMGESLAKLLLNSLYGKTGQLSPSWYPITEENLSYAEQVYNLPSGTLSWMLSDPPNVEEFEKDLLLPEFRTRIPLRQLWQNVEMQIGQRETRDSCPQIAACVTSAARMKLRLLQEIAGATNYCYSDTDSLWVNETGLQNLSQSGALGNECGKLEVKGVCDSITIYGRKDYCARHYRKYSSADTPEIARDVIKRKGIRAKAVELSDGRFKQEKWQRPISQVREGNRGYVAVETIVKTLSRGITHCRVLPNGFTVPLFYTGVE